MNITSSLVERLRYDLNKASYEYGTGFTKSNVIVHINKLNFLIENSLYVIDGRDCPADNKSVEYGLALAAYVLRYTNVRKLNYIRCPRYWTIEKKNRYNRYIKDIIEVWELLSIFYNWDKYRDIADSKNWITIFMFLIPLELL